MKHYFLGRGMVPKLLSVCAVVIIASAPCQGKSLNPKTGQVTDQEKVSKFGEYRGYSERKYFGFDRESKYMAVGDGTRLVFDIYHPTKNGVHAEKKLPALNWMIWYCRADLLSDGSMKSLRSWINSREIADPAYYLTSEAACHIIGQKIAVDGKFEWEQSI